MAALVTSGFWLALTAGRLAGAAWGSRLTPYALLWRSVSASLVGGLLLVLGAGNVPLTVSAVLVIGFFFGPPYPTMIAITTAAFPDGPGKAASVVAALGSVGGMLVPWMQGVALDRGGESANAVFVAAGMLVMVLAYGGVRLVRKPRAHQYAPGSP
jgi:fucose permease